MHFGFCCLQHSFISWHISCTQHSVFSAASIFWSCVKWSFVAVITKAHRLPFLLQDKSVQVLTTCFFNIHFNIILPPPMSSKWSLSLNSPYQSRVSTSSRSHLCHMSRPSYAPKSDHPNCLWWMAQIMNVIIILFSAISYFLPFIPKYHPHYSIFNHPQPVFLLRTVLEFHTHVH